MSDESKPLPDDQNESRSDAPEAEITPAEEYKVGPGQPPKEYTWKKGDPTPNPTGRRGKNPSMQPDLKKLFENILKKKIRVTTKDQKKQLLSRLELGFEQLANQFAKGDRHARRDVFAIAEKLGVDLLAGAGKVIEALAPDHQAILDAFVRRRTSAAETSPGAPEIAPPELLDDDVTIPEATEPTASPAPGDEPTKPETRTAQEIHDERLMQRIRKWGES